MHRKQSSASGYCYCGHASCFQCTQRWWLVRRMIRESREREARERERFMDERNWIIDQQRSGTDV